MRRTRLTTILSLVVQLSITNIFAVGLWAFLLELYLSDEFIFVARYKTYSYAPSRSGTRTLHCWPLGFRRNMFIQREGKPRFEAIYISPVLLENGKMIVCV